jgi:hypothetical protein
MDSPEYQRHRNQTYSNVGVRHTSIGSEAGVALAHRHLSILYTTHLYNAAQQKRGLLGGTWSEIETDIETYIHSLFFGGRPKTPEDAFKRYCVRIGLPPSQLVLSP